MALINGWDCPSYLNLKQLQIQTSGNDPNRKLFQISTKNLNDFQDKISGKD